jgi:diacylglycerol kinase (ATP)
MIEKLRSRFAAYGYSVEFQATERPQHATELARNAAASSADLVIACGGDGTIQEVASGLAHSKTPLAILPSGTANVLARELNIPRNPLDAADCIPSLTPRRIAVGRCGVDYFLLMAGVGMDAETIDQVDPLWKSRVGTPAFWYAGLRHWSTGGFTPLSVVADGTEYRCSFIVAGRVSRYGGSLRIARQASLFSDRFDLCMFPGETRLDYLRYFAGVLSGTHHHLHDVICTPAHTVEISSEKPVRYQLDGELKGFTPIKLNIVPDALTLLVP